MLTVQDATHQAHVVALLKPKNLNFKSTVRKAENTRLFTALSLIGFVLFAACCSAALLLTNSILDGNQRNNAIMKQITQYDDDF